MKYNTRNPVGTDGSTDPRDMYDNAGNLDLALQSDLLTWKDRLGRDRPTYKKYELDAQEVIDQIVIDGAAAIDTLIMVSAGDFFTGTVVTARNQTVLWSTENGGNGHEFRWAGALNKTVPAESTPLTTGGIYPDGLWIDVGVTQLRRDLAPVAGIKHLRKLPNIRQTALSFHDGLGVGGGDYIWLPGADQSEHLQRGPNGGILWASNAIDLYDGTPATRDALLNYSGTGQGCWEMLPIHGTASEETCPEIFGSVSDYDEETRLGTDNYVALQAMANTGRTIVCNMGKFYTSSPIQLQQGQEVKGKSKSEKTIFACLTPAGGVFWYTNDETTGECVMPKIKHVRLIGDYPVRFNNEQTAIIANTEPTNVPFGMKPSVVECDLEPRMPGVGIGVSWSKMFDGDITDSNISDFGMNVLLNGCDLCRVEHNRSRRAYSYHILELSASSFGSQNEIRHNDILQAGSTACIFIKSTARHARIYNNYLEQAGGTDGAALKGFIDASSVSAPSFGGNTSGGRFTTVIEDNRIDGHIKASEFIYRYQPGGQTYGRIIDVGTTGNEASAETLKLVDSTGDVIDSVPYLFNQLNLSTFEFAGPKFGKWNGFKTESEYSLKISGKNLSMFGPNAIYEHRNHLAARGCNLVIKNGLEGNFLLPYPVSENFFLPGRNYKITVVARSVTGPETLSIAGLINGVGDTLKDFNLSTKFKKYTLSMLTSDSIVETNGVYMQRSNNGSEIEVKSIEIEQMYSNQIPRTVASSIVFTVEDTVGKIKARADGNGTLFAHYNYEFVDNFLVVCGSNVENSAQINISHSQSGRQITFNVTGAGLGKAIRVAHEV